MRWGFCLCNDAVVQLHPFRTYYSFFSDILSMYILYLLNNPHKGSTIQVSAMEPKRADGATRTSNTDQNGLCTYV
jgi:hypothetical protein